MKTVCENEAFQKYEAETVSANSNEVRSAHTHTLSFSVSVSDEWSV